MWYTIYVRANHEEEIVEQCRKRVIEGDEKIFTMKGERMFRVGPGQYELRTKPLFQNYLFADITDPESFWIRLRRVKTLTKMLKTGEDLHPIYPEEEEFLKALGGEEHIVKYSIGYKEGDRLIVEDGPMRGLEGKVKKIDRHHRMAILSVNLMGQEIDVKLGLEILSRS